MTNFTIGALLTWPIGVWVGNKMKSTQGGVPIVHYTKFSHDFQNVEPTIAARRYFRWYFFTTLIAGGVFFANYTVNEGQKKDPWYQRPDLRPFPAMVAKEELDITHRTALETHY
jgi:hypothetical protein